MSGISIPLSRMQAVNSRTTSSRLRASVVVVAAPVVEVEEMVVATPDFSYEDYLYVRVFHLLLTIFFYEGNFDEPFAWARRHGLNANLVFAARFKLDRQQGQAVPAGTLHSVL